MVARLLFVFLAALLVASSECHRNSPGTYEDAFRSMQSSKEFRVFLSLLEGTELDSILNSTARPLTIFAPNDDAFRAGYKPILTQEQLVDVVRLHVAKRFYKTSKKIHGSMRTFNGWLNATEVNHTAVLQTEVGNARVSMKPLYVKKPVAVYKIDAVLIPNEFEDEFEPKAIAPGSDRSSPIPSPEESPVNPFVPVDAPVPAPESSHFPSPPSSASSAALSFLVLLASIMLLTV